MRYKKVLFQWPVRNEPFLIVIYHSTLVKGAMNAAYVCKLRTGVKKNASISSFFTGQRQNKDHSALVNCGGIEFLKLRLAHFMIVNCGMKEKHLIQMHGEYSPQLSKLMA